MTTTEERRRRKEQRREQEGILPPSSIAAVVRSFLVLLLLAGVTVWSVRFLKPYQTKTLGPYLRETWVVAGGCLMFLLAMLVLRYRRIRADELADTNAGQGTRPIQTRDGL